MILIFILLLGFSNIALAANYSDASNRLLDLGILNISGRENNDITRGDFAKAIVIATGHQEDAQTLAGSDLFPDVSSRSVLSGYVDAAVTYGLMTGTFDGNFHPEKTMQFQQIYSILVKALGYQDTDLQGGWPKGYLLKAGQLGITSGISLKNTDPVPMWAAALMINRFLDCDIKSGSTGSAETMMESAGFLNDSFQYGGIINPVYSDPQVVQDLNQSSTKIGDIDLSGNPKIIKNGVPITVNDIEDQDVLYQVSDQSGAKNYILDVDNKISGTITKLSGTSIQIDNKDYDFSKDFDFTKTLNSFDSLEIGDYVTLLMGYDGKVVDFSDVGSQDNSNFAFVVNYSGSEGYYRVKMLTIDGNVKEYNIADDPENYKGQLVYFTMTDNNTVSLRVIADNNFGGNLIDKYDRLLDTNYVSHNVKIFNVIADNKDNSQDAQVELVKWADMPSQYMDPGRITYVNRAGNYNEINVILANNILGNEYESGIVQDVTGNISNVNGSPQLVWYTYKVMVDGSIKQFPAGTTLYYPPGSVLKVVLNNGNIESVAGTKDIAETGTKIDSLDVNWIKINGNSYNLSKNTQVYFRSTDGTYTLKSISDIETDRSYAKISLYLNEPKSSGGAVDTIIINE